MTIRKPKTPKLHAGDMEIIVARHFHYSANLIVPNVSWGLGFIHELDLIVVSPSGWAKEIEIKVTLADLKADGSKRHGHYSAKIRELYFAVPYWLEAEALQIIPKHAGLIVAHTEPAYVTRRAVIIRTARINKNARRLTDTERDKLRELAAMRLWSLKEHLYRLQRGQ